MRDDVPSDIAWVIKLEKEMKRIIVALLLLGTFSCTSKKDQVSVSQAPPIKEASELVANLVSSFKNKSSHTVEYPDYFGGVYVENEKCFILIVGDTVDAQKDLLIRCQGKGFITLPCIQSRNSLQSIIETLNSFMKHHEEQCQQLKMYGFSLDEIHNKIRIMIGDISSENIARFKATVIDSPFIDFQESSPIQYDEEIIQVR